MMMNLALWVVAAIAAGALGGAATGIKIGGEVMGNQLAALMGGFFALSAVVPATLIAIIIHALR